MRPISLHRVNIKGQRMPLIAMNNRTKAVSGAAVFFGLIWYYVFPNMIACGTTETGDPIGFCEDVLHPMLTYFCGVPPLIIACMVYALQQGERKPVELHQLKTEENGQMVVPASFGTQTQQMSAQEWSGRVMTLSAFSLAGGYAFIFIVGLLAIPFLVLCGSMGSNCSDSDFLWAENSIAAGYIVMRISVAVFALSAVIKGILDFKNPADVDDSAAPVVRVSGANVIVRCAACKKKIKFPSSYVGEVQCPKCNHVFLTGNQ